VTSADTFLGQARRRTAWKAAAGALAGRLRAVIQRLISGKRLFLHISVLLVLSDALFVVMNYHVHRQTLNEEWQEQWDRAFATYDLALSEQFDTMLMLARFIAENEQIQRLFLEGRRAVQAEGGGPGRAAAHMARVRLYEYLAPAWHRVSQEYGIRQVHFHLGPGSLSFLRVHQPDRYGDRMDDLRHIIVDTNADGVARSGFETGRIDAGLRGVVPVNMLDEHGLPTRVGVLEVGTSFRMLVSRLDEVLGAGVAVLLNRDHISEAMWDEFVDARFINDMESCQCAVEARSRSDIFRFIEAGAVQAMPLGEDGYRLVRLEDRDYLLMQRPLQDYRGMRDGSPPIGRVLLWRDVTPRMATFHHDQVMNALFALTALTLIELCLFFAIRFILRAKAAAEQSSRAKSCFLAIMSHELRTPLNAVIGFSEMLGAQAAGPVTSKQKEYLEDIQGAGGKLLGVVDDVLQYAHLEGGRYRPDCERLDLARLVHGAMARLRPLADAAGQKLDLHAGTRTEIEADARTLRRVVDNLLACAMAGSPAGSSIGITLSSALNQATITVTDAAPTMTPRQIDQLLHPLNHDGDAYTGGLGDTGLRLALAKAFVQAHGGWLDIEPAPGATGNIVRLTLPRQCRPCHDGPCRTTA
jgi:signal transduction histidine kinase